MESQITLYLENANKQQFENWLNDYTRNVNTRVFPFMGEQCFVVSDMPIWENNSLVKIDCANDIGYFGAVSHINENGTESEKRIIDHLTVLRFNMFQNATRLKIRITHYEGIQLFPYVARLLWQLGQDWPGASQPVNEYIIQCAKRYGIEIPEQSGSDGKIMQPLIIPPPSPDIIHSLSEVERLSKMGWTVQSIAVDLSISESTVKRYRKKLGIRKRKQ